MQPGLASVAFFSFLSGLASGSSSLRLRLESRGGRTGAGAAAQEEGAGCRVRGCGADGRTDLPRGSPHTPALCWFSRAAVFPTLSPGCLSQLQLLTASAGIRLQYPFWDAIKSGASGFWMWSLGSWFPGKGGAGLLGHPSLSCRALLAPSVRSGGDGMSAGRKAPRRAWTRSSYPRGAGGRRSWGSWISTWTERAAAVGLCHESG